MVLATGDVMLLAKKSVLAERKEAEAMQKAIENKIEQV